MVKPRLLVGISDSVAINKIRLKVAAILEAILEQDLWIDDFYLHPLGFYYCRLFVSEQNQIRLHIWLKGYAQKKDLYIHDHFYDLCSWVLCGKIKDYTYEVSNTDKESDYSLFTSSYKNDKNVRTITKTAQSMSVALVSERILSRGDKYYIPRGSFHSNDIIFDSHDITFTCVYTYNHKDDNSPNVIGYLRMMNMLKATRLNCLGSKLES